MCNYWRSRTTRVCLAPYGGRSEELTEAFSSKQIGLDQALANWRHRPHGMNRLLSADPSRLGRPDVPPSADAVDEELVGGTPEGLKADLIEMLGEDLVRHRISDLVRYASDASPYRYIPNVIVQPKNIDHVAAVFQILHSQEPPCDLPGRRNQPERPSRKATTS